MGLLDLLNKKSEWLHLKIYRGESWVEHFDEFQELLARGDISVERIRGETVIVVKQEFTDAEMDQQIKGCLSRYSKWEREGIQKAFDIFHQVRKRGKMSKKAFLRTLRSWEVFNKTSIGYGVRQYIRICQKEKHGEVYCTGLIRVIDQKRQLSGEDSPKQERVRSLLTKEQSKERRRKIKYEQMVNRLFAERGGGNMEIETAKLLLMSVQEEATALLGIVEDD